MSVHAYLTPETPSSPVVAVTSTISPPRRDRTARSGTTAAAVETARSKTSSRRRAGRGPARVVRVMLREPPLARMDAQPQTGLPREGTWRTAFWTLPALSVARQVISSVDPADLTFGAGKERTGPGTRKKAAGVTKQRDA
jgi:hypothetical protein